MKIIAFSFDSTLVDTSACKPFLHRAALVSGLVEKVEQGAVSTSIHERGIVGYVNDLQRDPEVLVLVVTDEPTAFCQAVLSKHGFNITAEHVFGGQSKPCVDLDQIIISLYGKDTAQHEFLVDGHSPKDLHFGYHINSPIILTTWATEFDLTAIGIDIRPAGVASNLIELKRHVDSFLAGQLNYEKPELKRHIRTIDPANTSIAKLHQTNIGYARDYISSIHLPGNTDGRAHYTWMDINFGLKLAKGYSAQAIDSRQTMPICIGGAAMHRGLSLKNLAKYYFSVFVNWIMEKGLKGPVALVPMPSSVPSVCNLSSAMALVCAFWVDWAKEAGLSFSLLVCDVLERWRPVQSSHLHFQCVDERTIEPHLSSIGVVGDEDTAIPYDVAAVIIIDDVVTTGTQMNAAVTILNGLEVVRGDVPVFGFAWGRTVCIGSP